MKPLDEDRSIIGQVDRLIRVSRSTADRWVRAAVVRAEELGALPPGHRISSHTLRHSYARHLLVHGVPINYLSHRLGTLFDPDDAHLLGVGTVPD